MTEKSSDGGPAFPSAPALMKIDALGAATPLGYEGMSLRAYFAAKVLPHCLSRALANRERYSDTFSDHVPDAVREASRIADYMVKELDKSKSSAPVVR